MRARLAEPCREDAVVEVPQVYAREQEVGVGTHALTAAVATNLHKLLVYKDEYEVGRLAAVAMSDVAAGRSCR